MTQAADIQKKKQYRDLAFLMALAILLRVSWALLARPEPFIDSAEYFSMARQLADQGHFGNSAYRLPGFPLYLRLLMFVSRDLGFLMAGSIALSAGLIIPLYSLFYRLTGVRGAAFMAGLIAAVNPTFVYFGPVLASEHTEALCLVTALYLAVSLKGSASITRIVLIASLLAYATLSRGEGLFYVPVLMFCLYLYDEGPASRKIYRALAMGLLAVVLLVPWAVRNRIVIGSWVGLSTTGGMNFFLAHNPKDPTREWFKNTPLQGLPDIKASREGFRLGWQFIREHPGRNLYYILRNTVRLYAPTSYAFFWSANFPPSPETGEYRPKPIPFSQFFFYLSHLGWLCIFAAALASLFFFRRLSKRSWLVLGSALAANWFFYAVVFLAIGRYRYIAELFICGLAGFALYNVYRMLRRVKEARP